MRKVRIMGEKKRVKYYLESEMQKIHNEIDCDYENQDYRAGDYVVFVDYKDAPIICDEEYSEEEESKEGSEPCKIVYQGLMSIVQDVFAKSKWQKEGWKLNVESKRDVLVKTVYVLKRKLDVIGSGQLEKYRKSKITMCASKDKTEEEKKQEEEQEEKEEQERVKERVKEEQGENKRKERDDEKGKSEHKEEEEEEGANAKTKKTKTNTILNINTLKTQTINTIK